MSNAIVPGSQWVTAYDPAVALRVIEALAEGHTLEEICQPGTGLPSRAIFRRWVVQNPDLAAAYRAAMEISANSLEEEALRAARAVKDKPGDGTNVRATEVYIGQLRWSAERRNPAVYGTRQQVSVRVPIQINTTLDMGKDSEGSGTAEHPDIYKLDAKVKVPLAAAPTPAPLPVQPRSGKRILTPPGGKPTRPATFGKIARGEA